VSRPNFPFGEDVAIARREVVGVDDYGNDVREMVTTTIPDCVIWPRTSVEYTDARDTVITGITVLIPPDIPVLPTDKFIVRDEEYDVTATPFDWSQNPWTNSRTGTQVELRQVTG
jgi:hypothetical protein